METKNTIQTSKQPKTKSYVFFRRRGLLPPVDVLDVGITEVDVACCCCSVGVTVAPFISVIIYLMNELSLEDLFVY